MLPEIVADENVDHAIIVSLRSAGYSVHSIAHEHETIFSHRHTRTKAWQQGLTGYLINAFS